MLHHHVESLAVVVRRHLRVECHAFTTKHGAEADDLLHEVHVELLADRLALFELQRGELGRLAPGARFRVWIERERCDGNEVLLSIARRLLGACRGHRPAREEGTNGCFTAAVVSFAVGGRLRGHARDELEMLLAGGVAIEDLRDVFLAEERLLGIGRHFPLRCTTKM